MQPKKSFVPARHDIAVQALYSLAAALFLYVEEDRGGAQRRVLASQAPIRCWFGLNLECLQRLALRLINTRIDK